MIAGIWNTYEEYLCSWQWQDKRKIVLSVKPNCDICGKKATTVHHKNYERVGQEKMKDLQSLCYQCHLRIHKK